MDKDIECITLSESDTEDNHDHDRQTHSRVEIDVAIADAVDAGTHPLETSHIKTDTGAGARADTEIANEGDADANDSDSSSTNDFYSGGSESSDAVEEDMDDVEIDDEGDPVIVNEKVHRIEALLQQLMEKIKAYDSYEITTGNPKVEVLANQEMLGKLHKTYQEVSSKLKYLADCEEEPEPHYLKIPTNYGSGSRYQDERKAVIPVINKYLKAEAIRNGGHTFPNVSEIVDLIKHVLPEKGGIACELADELLHDLREISKQKPIDWNRWITMGGTDDAFGKHNNLSSDSSLAHQLERNVIEHDSNTNTLADDVAQLQDLSNVQENESKRVKTLNPPKELDNLPETMTVKPLTEENSVVAADTTTKDNGGAPSGGIADVFRAEIAAVPVDSVEQVPVSFQPNTAEIVPTSSEGQVVSSIPESQAIDAVKNPPPSGSVSSLSSSDDDSDCDSSSSDSSEISTDKEQPIKKEVEEEDVGNASSASGSYILSSSEYDDDTDESV